MINDWLKTKLKDREATDLLRKLSFPAGRIDFTSNDYLGLSRSEELFQQIHQRTHSLNHLNGATGSRLLSGNSAYAEEIEQKLAAIFHSESTLIFNSGYTANLALLSSVPQREDTILLDELAHACIKDGARLSLAKHFNFRHNDLNDLETKIKRATGKIFIAVESVYSMDGDQCPLSDLVLLAEKYDASIILDEAHSTGVMGENGSGLSTSLNLEDKIPFRIYTFGKAMGVHGACVAGSKAVRDYLVNFARPFIYTTALPPHSLVSIDCAFDFLGKNIDLQKTLKNKINLFLLESKNSVHRTASSSAIQTAIIPGNSHVRQAASRLQQKGFDIRPILSPTVAVGSERLRICLHTYNTDEEFYSLTAAMAEINAISS